jgi:hypothetical protein
MLYGFLRTFGFGVSASLSLLATVVVTVGVGWYLGLCKAEG